MAITFERDQARFTDTVSVDEAEVLIAWLHENPEPNLDLEACTHIHAAPLQVLMAARVPVATWPHDPAFAAWLHSALT